MINDRLLLEYAKETIKIEINEALHMLDRLDESIVVACQILLRCEGKVIVSGIGKSGHIGKKLAASLSSTGTPAFFMHPSEALHGDLGMIESKDVVIFISYSGRSYEISLLIPVLIENNIPIIALTGNSNSPLAVQSNCVLNIQIQREACPMELVPTSSAVNALMMGDALTMSLMRYKGFSIEKFAQFHPGGTLGAQLLNCVHHVMRIGNKISKVFWKSTVMDAMFELLRTGLGLTAVCDDNQYVIGVFTDEDLRRWIIQQDKSLKDSICIAMTKPGHYVAQECRVDEAIKILYKLNITAAPVVDKSGILVGSISINDLYKVKIIE
ncbi:arabinose 5-phosphate isomerase [Candidatus Blochmanniella vafra str. BVAF]|uniref:Arabinose 5-phosphate isomerase n=1 Tax=Blochmanniella vafra (strain BVAF) TaxID=859654 RepID=E8Q722_BLOVB|nr:arabinose-5-phosphate isomerase GutQ [Candidatus Blochmannia vafer]ADV33846.1 arabinose 5-phosphate isomerase [Candidatus Blochmannia vafer str. BVAF]